MMRIGVDMAATVGQKSGFGFYVENVVGAMRELPGDHELVQIERVKKNLRTPSRMMWDRIGLPLTACTKKLDLLWVPAFSAPRFNKPVVMTAHDIFGVIYPEHFSGAAARYWTKILPESMKRADHLLCVSEHTKNDIARELGIPEEKMTVTPLAAADHFRVVDDVPAIEKQLRSLKIEPPFILAVGTLEPRKNLARLVDAYAFAERGDATLVIVGKKGWEYEDVFAKIRKYNLHNAVQIVDYVNTDQLVALYNACLFFVMPSLYEGFGLPALEAMSCGAPVAVAQNSSLPEVVGDAGVLFDPFDVEDMRARLNLLFTNDEMRTEMQRKSVEHARQFSWKKTAELSLAVMRETLGNTER